MSAREFDNPGPIAAARTPASSPPVFRVPTGLRAPLSADLGHILIEVAFGDDERAYQHLKAFQAGVEKRPTTA